MELGNANSGCGEKEQIKKVTNKLRISNKKDENFGDWYTEVVVKGQLVEYHNVSGCYVLRPWTMSIWNTMKKFFDAEIEKMGVVDSKFPLFVHPVDLQREKDHLEGFAPEVAWVTKAGRSDLEVPIAIRPTSEAVIYPYFAKWIRGHYDLPLKLNQWCNVVRWEFSNHAPFIRSREFDWQEGHTAFATKEEADVEVEEMLELHRRIYEEYLAVPVIKGMKSELEKFTGGLYSMTVEAFIPQTGRGIQGATSHSLGQNFAKAFKINYQNEKGQKAMVWQNSWGYSTRTIGVMVMIHGDDKGLVLPPKVASVQVIVVPVDKDEEIVRACTSTVKTLNKAGIRSLADFSSHSRGWKYAHWEMKGVPLRIEIGRKEVENSQVHAIFRVSLEDDNSIEKYIPMANMVEKVKELLDTIQQRLFNAAKQRLVACTKTVWTWDEFIEALGQKKLILAPWCDEEEVEKDVKRRTRNEMGACKTLCSPIEQPQLPEGTLCFATGKIAKKWTYWGRRC